MKEVALITGASSGLGRDFAVIHANSKKDVVIVARSEDKLLELKSELEETYGITVKVIVKDLSIYESAIEIYNELKAENIEIKYLINNAGFGGIGKFHERDWQNDMQMINLNIMALTHLSRLFINDFVEKNEGRILNISSTASLIPGPLQAVYFATKAYVTSFSNALSEELSDTNISVTALLPGATETKFGAVSGMDKTMMFKNTAKSMDVAKDGYNAMMNEKINKISGLPLAMKLAMKFTALLPTKMILKTVKKMQQT
jgi:short-subunit dehydrogenase